MTKYFACLFLFLFKVIVCQVDNSEYEQDLIKKTKILGCIAISKSRMVQDQKVFDALISNINKKFEINDGRNKLLSLCLVNCYKKISSEKAFEIISSVHGTGHLDSMTEENKKLLGVTDDDAFISEFDKDSFVKDFQEINMILKDMNKDNDNLKRQHGQEIENKNGQKANEKIKSSKSLIEETSFIPKNVIEFLHFWKSLFNNLLNFIELNNYIGIAFLIVISFLVLNLLKKLCERMPNKKKTVKKQTKIHDDAGNISKSKNSDKILKDD